MALSCHVDIAMASLPGRAADYQVEDMTESRPTYSTDNDLREFMLILKRALLMVVAWIDKKYGGIT